MNVMVTLAAKKLWYVQGSVSVHRAARSPALSAPQQALQAGDGQHSPHDAHDDSQHLAHPVDHIKQLRK